MPHLLDERAPPAPSPAGFALAPASTSPSPVVLPPPHRFLCTTSLPTPAARSPPEIPPADRPAPDGVARDPRCAAEALRDWTGCSPTPPCLPPVQAMAYDSA